LCDGNALCSIGPGNLSQPEWGKHDTVEEYLKREQLLLESPFSATHESWILIKKSKHDSKSDLTVSEQDLRHLQVDDILASCETFQRTGWWNDQGTAPFPSLKLEVSLGVPI
jgi:hypothetical protein